LWVIGGFSAEVAEEAMEFAAVESKERCSSSERCGSAAAVLVDHVAEKSVSIHLS